MSESIAAIYHMTPRSLWEAQAASPSFAPPSLADEGFIHCTAEPDRLLLVANTFYRDLPGAFIIVRIAPERLSAGLRWEWADGHLFPHIYGPVNEDAVDQIIEFPRLADGTFCLPPEMSVSEA
jgi:uncharacterized protein (DUF952 family)